MNPAVDVFLVRMDLFGGVLDLLVIIGLSDWIFIGAGVLGFGYLVYKLGTFDRPSLSMTDRSMRKL